MKVEPNTGQFGQVGVRRAALASLASYGIPVLIGLVAMPIAFRLLGAPKFGLLSITLLSPTLAASLDFGASTAAVRRMSAEFEGRGNALGSALGSYALVLLAIGIVLGAAVFASAPILAEWLGFGSVVGEATSIGLLRLCAVWMWLSLALAMPAIVLRARQRFIELTIVQSLSTLAVWTAVITLAVMGESLWLVVSVLIVITVLNSGACLVMARHEIPGKTQIGLDLSMVRNDFRFSSGLFLMQLSSMLAVQLDRVFVASLASPAAAGIYALCVGVANKTLFAISSLTSFAYPRVAAMHGRDMSTEIGELLRVLLRVALVLIAPTILPAMILAGPFLSLWLGSASDDSVQLMRLLWLGYAIAAVCAPATHVIIGTGTARLAALFAWLTAALLLSGLYLFVPRLDLVGAGMANLIALSSALLFLAVVRRQLAVPRDLEVWRIAFGIVVGCAAQLAFLLALLPQVDSWGMLFLASAGSLAVYQLVRWALRTLSGEEHRLIQSIAMRLR